MGGPGNCAIHVVSGTDQFCFRSGNVRFALVDFRRVQPAKTVLVSIGLVRGGLAVTDSDRPHDSDPPRALFPELALYATCVDYDRHCYNRGNSAVYGNWFSNRFSTAAD